MKGAEHPAARGASLPRPTALGALAASHGGTADEGAAAIEVARVAPVEIAAEGDLAPVLVRRFVQAAIASRAALLVDESLAPLVPAGRRWTHPHAAYALARLLATIAPRPELDTRASAYVSPGALVDSSAALGPGAVIMAGAVVGPEARVEANAVVYGGVVIGERAVVGAGAVVGRPGFGWVRSPEDGELVRMPHAGGVVVEDDAEIGPLSTVDAGTLVPTRIGRGAKLDAHVHVGHNAVVGPGAIVAAQAGFAGSVRIGAGALVGGQAGVADHVRVGDGARIAAQAGVIGDVPPRATVAGYPAVDRLRWLRSVARALDPKPRCR